MDVTNYFNSTSGSHTCAFSLHIQRDKRLVESVKRGLEIVVNEGGRTSGESEIGV